MAWDSPRTSAPHLLSVARYRARRAGHRGHRDGRGPAGRLRPQLPDGPTRRAVLADLDRAGRGTTHAPEPGEAGEIRRQPRDREDDQRAAGTSSLEPFRRRARQVKLAIDGSTDRADAGRPERQARGERPGAKAGRRWPSPCNAASPASPWSQRITCSIGGPRPLTANRNRTPGGLVHRSVGEASGFGGRKWRRK